MRLTSVLVMGLVACGDHAPSSAWDTNGQFSAECTAGATTTYTVRLEGKGLVEYEGKMAYTVTESLLSAAPGTCRTAVSARIVDGGFEILLAGRSDDGATHPFVGGYIDVDGDGVCSDGVDRVWGETRRFAPPDDVTYEVSPDEMLATQATNCQRLLDGFPWD